MSAANLTLKGAASRVLYRDSMEENRCTFVSDVIAKNGGGWTRIKDVRCERQHGHLREGGDNEHEFIAAGAHTFGAVREKGRWVSR